MIIIQKIQEYRAKIKAVGLKATPQRISILKVLTETDCHPSADMLIKMLEKEGHVMSVGTIYNILDTFEEKGLIIKLHDQNEVMRFDAITAFHVHVIDDETNSIQDVHDEKLESLISQRLNEILPEGLAYNHMELILKV